MAFASNNFCASPQQHKKRTKLMQRPTSKEALQAEFGDSIRAAQQHVAGQGTPASDTAAPLPNIDAKAVLSGDSANGDIADLGICKMVFDFLQQLHRRFPQRKKLKFTVNSFWKLAQADLSVPGTVLRQMYDKCVARKKNVFHERTDENERIVVDELSKVVYFQMCHIKTMWRIDGEKPLDVRTRKTIWEHVTRIIRVVNILSKFSSKSRKTLNRLANETLNDQERQNVQQGNFDVVGLLDNIKDRVLDSDDMMESIVEVADQHSNEMKDQGMTEEQLNAAPF